MGDGGAPIPPPTRANMNYGAAMAPRRALPLAKTAMGDQLTDLAYKLLILRSLIGARFHQHLNS